MGEIDFSQPFSPGIRTKKPSIEEKNFPRVEIFHPRAEIFRPREVSENSFNGWLCGANSGAERAGETISPKQK